MSHQLNSSPSGAGKIFLVLMLCALSFLLHAWLRTQVLTTGYKVSDKSKTKNFLEAELIDLKVAYARLLDEKHLETLKKQLAEDESWQTATPEQIVFLGDGGSEP
jgi:hypothetical protein